MEDARNLSFQNEYIKNKFSESIIFKTFLKSEIYRDVTGQLTLLNRHGMSLLYSFASECMGPFLHT